jgi:hypothetical protein
MMHDSGSEPGPHEPPKNAPIAQLATLSKNTAELGHVSARAFVMQLKSIIGMPPPPMPLKQLIRAVTAVEQLCSVHVQSPCVPSGFVWLTLQLMQSSLRAASQMPLPQCAHEPQSGEQLAQFSVARLQRPSPHRSHWPQSPGHVKQSSPCAALQV